MVHGGRRRRRLSQACVACCRMPVLLCSCAQQCLCTTVDSRSPQVRSLVTAHWGGWTTGRLVGLVGRQLLGACNFPAPIGCCVQVQPRRRCDLPSDITKMYTASGHPDGDMIWTSNMFRARARHGALGHPRIMVSSSRAQSSGPSTGIGFKEHPPIRARNAFFVFFSA